MTSLASLPRLAAGNSLISAHTGVRGTLGLVAISESGDLVGLTVSSVVRPGHRGFTDARRRLLRAHLGPAEQLDLRTEADELPASSMIVSLPLDARVRVRSNFAGLEEPRAVPPLRSVAHQRLYLVREEEAVPLGKLDSIGATVFRTIEGCRQTYFDAAEIICPNSANILRKGDAGAAIATEYGEPLGLMIGARPDMVIFAPFESLLSDNQLSPLAIVHASNWRKLVQTKIREEQAARRERQDSSHLRAAELHLFDEDVYQSSDDVRQRYAGILEPL